MISRTERVANYAILVLFAVIPCSRGRHHHLGAHAPGDATGGFRSRTACTGATSPTPGSRPPRSICATADRVERLVVVAAIFPRWPASHFGTMDFAAAPRCAYLFLPPDGAREPTSSRCSTTCVGASPTLTGATCRRSPVVSFGVSGSRVLPQHAASMMRGAFDADLVTTLCGS